MRSFILTIFVVVLCSGTLWSQDDSDSLFAKDSIVGGFLIINSFDAASLNARKNKKILFGELADSVKKILSNKLAPQYKDQLIIYPGLLPQTEKTDSIIFSLMADSSASTAIIIKNLDAYFENTGVEVTGNKDEGKNRKVSYDICAVITYQLYNREEKLKESEIRICESYSERNSLSSVITFGPDITKKRKDAFMIVGKNVEKLFLSPGLPLFSKNAIRQGFKIRRIDTLLKYSFSFADQSQLLYDGSPLKTIFNRSFIEWGDVSYYNGKYFNSQVRYWHAFGEMPGSEQNDDTGFSEIIIQDLSDVSKGYVKIYSRAITSVAMLFQTRGKFTVAETLLTRAMQMRATYLGKNSPEYFNSLHNLAVLKKDKGEYDEADSIFNYLQPVFESLFTTHSIQYVALLNNKAMLLSELGRTKEAIQLLDTALKTGADILNPSYIDYERILTNRALLEQESGNRNKAEEYYLLAIANMEKKGFDDHPDYNNLVVYYGSLRVQKNDRDVLAFLSNAADKVKKRYKEDHPMTAKAMSSIGDYYLNNKSYTEAKDLYSRVTNIQLKVLGGKHKDYLNTLMKLAVCEWVLHDKKNATLHFNSAIQNYLLLFTTFFKSMSESEKTDLWGTLKPAIDTYFAFAIESGKANPELLKDAYDLHLKTKGILINSTRQTKNIILNSGDTATRRLYTDWLNLKNTLSAYYSSTLEELKKDKIDLSALEQKANEKEKELGRRSARFNAEYTQPEISFDDVRRKLNSGEAAVEIIRIFHYYGNKKGESEYIALVAKKDSADPQLVRIGDGAGLENKYLLAYKNAIKNKAADDQSYINYWQPLESILGKSKTIYISVDGVYNNINLNTLQQANGNFLLDDHNLILVPNTKSVVTGILSTVQLSSLQSEAVLVGYPLFGNDELIPPLPGTKEEILKIDTMLLLDHIKTKIFLEQTASEENIKLTNRPFIFHIATHGFFNENVNLNKSMNMGVRVSHAKENALLRSGLLFNGAASIYNLEPVLDGSNNGVLYAYEVMNLDLQGTSFVVLSACETGVGEIVNGEGVYGLSRSFQIACAGKILMSLWKVDDKVTKEFMIAFYENLLKLKVPQLAFLQAQKTIKKKYPQPYYWGTFVMLN